MVEKASNCWVCYRGLFWKVCPYNHSGNYTYRMF